MTGSSDGQLKFWHKTTEGIEAVKQFRAHLGESLESPPPRRLSLRTVCRGLHGYVGVPRRHPAGDELG